MDLSTVFPGRFSGLVRFLETPNGPKAKNPVELVGIVKSIGSPVKGTGVSRTRKSHCRPGTRRVVLLCEPELNRPARTHNSRKGAAVVSRLLAELRRDLLDPMMGKDAWVAGADRGEAPGPKPVRLGRRLRLRRQPPGSWLLWNGGVQRGVSLFPPPFSSGSSRDARVFLLCNTP